MYIFLIRQIHSSIVLSSCCVPYTFRVGYSSTMLEEKLVSLFVIDGNIRQERRNFVAFPSGTSQEQM